MHKFSFERHFQDKVFPKLQYFLIIVKNSRKNAKKPQNSGKSTTLKLPEKCPNNKPGLMVQEQPLFLICSSITIFTSMGLFHKSENSNAGSDQKLRLFLNPQAIRITTVCLVFFSTNTHDKPYLQVQCVTINHFIEMLLTPPSTELDCCEVG